MGLETCTGTEISAKKKKKKGKKPLLLLSYKVNTVTEKSG